MRVPELRPRAACVAVDAADSEGYPRCMEALVFWLVVVATIVGSHLYDSRARRVVDDGPSADPAETAALDQLLSDQARLRGYY